MALCRSSHFVDSRSSASERGFARLFVNGAGGQSRRTTNCLSIRVYEAVEAPAMSTIWRSVAESTAKSIFVCAARPGAQSLTLCTKT